MAQEEFGQFGSIQLIGSWNKDCHLCKAVDYNEDGREVGRWGQLLDEIHGYGRPWMRGNREGFEVTVRLVPDSFDAPTRLTGINKGVDKFGHSQPEEGPANKRKCLSAAGMPCCR